MAQIQDTFAVRAASILAYNLGGGIVIGFVRTLLSVSYLAKYWFGEQLIEEAAQKERADECAKLTQKGLKRNHKIRSADLRVLQTRREYKKAKLWDIPAIAKHACAKTDQSLALLRSVVGEKTDDIKSEFKEARRQLTPDIGEHMKKGVVAYLQEQAIRGLLEMVWVGAPIYTSYALKDRSNSIFDLDNLVDYARKNPLFA